MSAAAAESVIAPISALFVVRDEAANIGRAVAAVRPLVGEVVVVDTGSADATRVLAKAAGARVLESGWHGYGPTKNLGAGACLHDWVLSLDADEVPDGELAAALADFAPEAGKVYGVRRVTNYGGRWIEHGAWGRDVVWRLYDRRVVRWDERVVHENLIVSSGLERARLPGRLLHFSYPTRAAFAAKQEHYLRLSVEALRQNRQDAGWIRRHVSPYWRGFRDYVLLGGWRDGRAGWEIARADVWMVREKYRRTREAMGAGGASPAHVVHVSLATDFRGGEAQAAYLISALAEEGLSQTLIAPGDAPLVSRVAHVGLEVVDVSGRAGAVRALLRRARAAAVAPAVAHAHDGHAHTACWLAALLGSGLDFVASRRVARAPTGGGWGLGKYRHPRLRALLCVSEAVAEIHRAALGPAAPVRRVSDAVRLPDAREPRGLRRLLGLRDDVAVVGTVAAIAPEKDYVTFAATCEILAAALPDAHFVHIGGGGEADVLAFGELAAMGQFGDRFHALGFRSDATALLGDFDVFLFTSRWEGLGSALLEAQARGVPVVTTDAGGTTEVVRDFETGRVGPVGAPEVLAEAVLDVLRDPEGTARMVETARRQLGAYSVARMVAGTLDAYAIGSRRA